MEGGGEGIGFVLLTQCFVIGLAAMQITLCFRPEWGGGFSLSDVASVQFFNYHPALNILAFAVAMTESLISYRSFNLGRRSAKTLHALLQLTSMLLGILAFTVVVSFHNANKFPNFYSVHSWVGLSVYVLAWSQFVASFFIFWLPNFVSGSIKAAFLRYHKIGGLVIYFAAMAAVATGLMQKQSFLRNNDPQAPLFGAANVLANATAVLAVFTSVGVLGILGFGRVATTGSSRVSDGDRLPTLPDISTQDVELSSHFGGIRSRTPNGMPQR